MQTQKVLTQFKLKRHYSRYGELEVTLGNLLGLKVELFDHSKLPVEWGVPIVILANDKNVGFYSDDVLKIDTEALAYAGALHNFLYNLAGIADQLN